MKSDFKSKTSATGVLTHVPDSPGPPSQESRHPNSKTFPSLVTLLSRDAQTTLISHSLTNLLLKTWLASTARCRVLGVRSPSRPLQKGIWDNAVAGGISQYGWTYGEIRFGSRTPASVRKEVGIGRRRVRKIRRVISITSSQTRYTLDVQRIHAMISIQFHPPSPNLFSTTPN
jgi:hypothetical protein